jgi:hypothetical protein
LENTYEVGELISTEFEVARNNFRFEAKEMRRSREDSRLKKEKKDGKNRRWGAKRGSGVQKTPKSSDMREECCPRYVDQRIIWKMAER